MGPPRPDSRHRFFFSKQFLYLLIDSSKLFPSYYEKVISLQLFYNFLIIKQFTFGTEEEEEFLWDTFEDGC